MDFEDEEPSNSNTKKKKVSSSEEDEDKRGHDAPDPTLVEEFLLRILEDEARTSAGKENERIAELKIRTRGRAMLIPQDELESLVTAQEITDEEIDRARDVTIEASYDERELRARKAVAQIMAPNQNLRIQKIRVSLRPRLQTLKLSLKSRKLPWHLRTSPRR